MTCSNCDVPLELVSGASPPQFDNALVIKFTGGYGMFIDDIYPDEYTGVLCHTCAHKLCSQIAWVNKLLNPERSHSHKHGRDWTGHTGWDLPHKQR